MKKIKVILFVEGDTDVVLFKALLEYYRQNSKKEIAVCEVVNMKSVTRYTSKFACKLENEFLPKAEKEGYEIRAVCCSYDTDVFEYGEQIPVDWKKVEREVRRLKIKEFYQIKVVHMIEDWLLDDMQGLCNYLKIKNVPGSIKGKDAFGKISALFKMGHKIYFKGNEAKKFVRMLNINVIRNKRKNELKELERVLGVEL